ncbi:sensor histidine kinase [Paenibacillus gansuensis]|uniref:histidine kinase n=1 Tax=Paenibacillus gansuensis TaxID=306542 RepID=A0ABW5P8S0_9BACL
MLLMVVIAVLPLSMVTLFATKTTKHSLSLEVIRSNESRMEWAAEYFDEKFDQMQAVSYSLLLDKNLFPNVNGSMNKNESISAELENYTIEKLRSLYNANNKNISQITLYLKSKQRLFIVDKDASRSTEQLRSPEADWSKLAQSNRSVSQILNNKQKTFTLVRSMNRFEDREVLGGVAIDVRWKMMNSVLDMVHSETNSQVFIVDAQGTVMYEPYSHQVTFDQSILKKLVSKPAEPGNIQLKQGFLFYQPAVSGQLWIIKFIPIEYVTQGSSSTLNFSFFTAVAFIIVAIVVSILTAYFMTKPIIRLTRSMKAVETQNFDVGPFELRSDEIGTLERRFNSMLSRIKELIQIEYKTKIEKRTAQVKALQAQINPHFLHNALQSIGGIALSRNVPEINEHVRAISDLFRYSIRMKSDLVTVSDEMEHVGNYLHIQKLRFQDMIHIQMNIDDECRNVLIPKFSLQPIVENCFIHGLEGKMETWTIIIRIEKLLDDIEISIEDNGVGIEEERLNQIRKELETEERGQGDSMGMSNVNARIKLLLGEEYGLFVTSKKSQGTTVKLLIPALLNPREGDLE